MQRLLSTLKRNILFFGYYAFAKRLPCSYARWGGRVYKQIRGYFGRRLLAGCGKSVNIEAGASFGRGNTVWLGDYSDLGIDCKINGEVHIGDHSFMGPDVVIYSNNHAFERTDIPIMYQGSSPINPVWIGNDVWIGTRVIILPGVRIGDHCVIGAGSVVTRDVADWAIVGGNPARVIRHRIASSNPATGFSACG